MMENRKIAYGLLLIGAIALLIVAVAPGNIYARYNAGASWNTVINAPSGALPVLTEDIGTLTLSVPEAGDNVQIVIEKMQPDGSYAEYTGDGLLVNGAGENIQIQTVEPLPDAGTYRLLITWTSEGAETDFSETVTFFVNYSDGKAREVTE